MQSLTEFAKSRNVDPKAVSIYLKRHNLKYDRSEGITDELMEILDKVYPVPKPVVVINGLDPEEERRLRKDLQDALNQLNAAKDMIVELTKTSAVVGLLEDKQKEQENLIQQQQQEIERLKNRGFLDRLLNK